MKTESVKAMLVRDFQRWLRPPSKAEAKLVEELRQSPHLTVPKLSPERLMLLGMNATHCHANCMKFVKDDTTAKHVLGWHFDPIDGGFYIPHSVVEQDSELLCLTPSRRAPGPFVFVRDPAMRLLTKRGKHVLRRNSKAFPWPARVDPERRIASVQEAKEELLGDPSLLEGATMELRE